MPSREALRERIELVESRVRGAVVRVLNLRMRADYALADVMVNDVRKRDVHFPYRQYFKSSQLK